MFVSGFEISKESFQFCEISRGGGALFFPGISEVMEKNEKFQGLGFKKVHPQPPPPPPKKGLGMKFHEVITDW